MRTTNTPRIYFQEIMSRIENFCGIGLSGLLSAIGMSLRGSFGDPVFRILRIPWIIKTNIPIRIVNPTVVSRLLTRIASKPYLPFAACMQKNMMKMPKIIVGNPCMNSANLENFFIRINLLSFHFPVIPGSIQPLLLQPLQPLRHRLYIIPSLLFLHLQN